MSRTPIIAAALLLMLIPSWALAQDPETTTTGETEVARDNFAQVSSDVGLPHMVHIRTNLLYDVALLPSVGFEFSLGGKWTCLADGTFMWLGNNKTHRYWRIASAGLEFRYWTNGPIAAALHRGHHLGLYTAAFRYDLEFGGTGQLADINYGVGLAYGYSTPIGRNLSLDFGLALGYIGGPYVEYKPIDTHYVWQQNKRRNYFGPIKAEITLVWHIELKKKGGEEW